MNDNQITALKDIMYEVHKTAIEKGWWEGGRNDGEMIALIHSELSEALEYLRQGIDTPSDHIPSWLGIEEEFADALIRIFDLAEGRKLDLAGALQAKIEFNKGREYKHGGKKF